MDVFELMRTFVAVAEAGSFAKGAERAGVSAKLASKYVAALEDRLGVRLLHRTTRQQSLTAEGERYLAEAAELLERLDLLETNIDPRSETLSGRIRVAAPMDFGQQFVVPLLGQFQTRHPGVEIDLLLADRYMDLAAEGIDLALRIGSLDDSALVARKIDTLAIWCVAHPAFQFDASTTGQQQLPAGTRLLRDSNARTAYTLPGHTTGKAGADLPAVSLSVNSGRAVVALAAAGNGIGFVLDVFAANALVNGQLQRLYAEHTFGTVDIQLIHLNARHRAERFLQLGKFLTEALRDELTACRAACETSGTLHN